MGACRDENNTCISGEEILSKGEEIIAGTEEIPAKKEEFPFKEEEIFAREEMIVGKEGLAALKGACVAVFGIGGVGGSCVEALARAGVGRLVLVDNDRFAPSNLNRQRFASTDTLGLPKAEAAAEGLKKINPFCSVLPLDIFFGDETVSEVPWDEIDFICDCIDSVGSKVLLAKVAEERGIGIISCMGTGNKFDPLAFRISDIYNTSVCPLARAMRKLLKEAGVRKLTVLYSVEEPAKTGSRTPGSISFVPPVAGMMIAGHVIKRIIGRA